MPETPLQKVPAVGHYLSLWQLEKSGGERQTRLSVLVPVLHKGRPAMLKLMKPGSDEGNAAALLSFWRAEGAVELLASDGPALLLEWGKETPSLKEMALGGRDEEASIIISGVIKRLHDVKGKAPEGLVPLKERFRSLFARADKDRRDGVTGSPYGYAADKARDLLSDKAASEVLHGDIHHDNILFSRRGWLAIDPKGLLGDPSYDVANALCNPYPESTLVHSRNRFQRQARIYVEALRLDEEKLMGFVFVHAHLAACWSIEEGEDPAYWLACAELVA